MLGISSNESVVVILRMKGWFKVKSAQVPTALSWDRVMTGLSGSTFEPKFRLVTRPSRDSLFLVRVLLTDPAISRLSLRQQATCRWNAAQDVRDTCNLWYILQYLALRMCKKSNN